jgi:hypothetical protein
VSVSVRVFLIGLLVCVQAVHAQPLTAELRVRIESNTGLPLSGALVALVDASDKVAAEGVTRVDGRRTRRRLLRRCFRRP